MADRRTTLLQGTLDLLILKALTTRSHERAASNWEKTAQWNRITLAIARALEA